MPPLLPGSIGLLYELAGGRPRRKSALIRRYSAFKATKLAGDEVRCVETTRMTAMSGTPCRTKRLTRALCAALGVAFIVGCGAGDVRAEEEAFDTKLIKGFLRGLGLRDGTEPQIEYRERSPLVVPPTRELPPPESVATPRNPAWPVDVDEKRRRAASRSRSRSACVDSGGERACAAPRRTGARPDRPSSG